MAEKDPKDLKERVVTYTYDRYPGSSKWTVRRVITEPYCETLAEADAKDIVDLLMIAERSRR